MYSHLKKEDNLSKYNLFLQEIKDQNNFSKKLDVLFDIQFLELFSKILNMPRLDFTKKLIANISYILSEEYEPKITENNDYITILYKCAQKYNRKYNEIIIPLIEAFEKHEMNIEIKNKESDYITNFRKHCYKTGKYAIHKCHKDYDEKGYFIPVYISKKIKYVICDSCRKAYVVTRFKNYCEFCHQIYYCNLLSKDENPELLPATWNPPHCESIINKNMYCNKCKEIFYLNLTNNQLQCINKKCNNIVEPARIQWNCPICNDLFRSGAKVFNYSEVEHCKYLIKKALILKQKAHPYKIPCCKDLIDFNKTEFYHGKNCPGILYFVESDEKLIVVCKACRAINWFSNFIWTCPKCKTRFRDINSDRNEEILKKSKCFEIQKLNKEKFYDEKTFRRKKTITNMNDINNDNNYSMKTINLRKNLNYSGKYNTANELLNSNIKYGNETERSKNYIKIDNNNINKDNTSTKVKSRGKYIFDKTIGKQLRSQKSEFLTLRIKEDRDNSKNIKEINPINNNEITPTNNGRKYVYKSRYEEINPINNNEITPTNNGRKYVYKSRYEEINPINNNETTPTNNGRKYVYKSKYEEINPINNNEITPTNNGRKNVYKSKYEEFRKNKIEQYNKINSQSTNNNITNSNENISENDNNNPKQDTNKRRILILKNHLKLKQKVKPESNSEKPDDIINASMINTRFDIPIENETIKNNSFLYENIQRKLKKILSKGKLPVFNIDNYSIGKRIGDGSFGTIFEATNNKTKIKYALKKIVTSDINNLEKYQKEFEIVHQSTHPNILDIHGICFRCFDQTTFIIYVLMDLALYDWEEEIYNRKKRNNNYYTEKQLISILKQLSSALLFLQKDKSISHRDIKPENILVFKNDIYKLSDFGEAENGAKIDERQKTLRGTELYMSPLLHEGLLHEVDYIVHNTFKSDVFSLGCCLIIAGCLDFDAIKEIRKLRKIYLIKNYLVKIFRRKYSDKFIDLLLKMINFEEKDRVDFIELDKIIKDSF